VAPFEDVKHIEVGKNEDQRHLEINSRVLKEEI
jgi:hypothetical protein